MDEELEQWIIDMKGRGWSDQEIVDSLVEGGYKRGPAMDAVREATEEESSFQPLDNEELEQGEDIGGSEGSSFSLPHGFFMDALKFLIYAVTALFFFLRIITLRIDIIFILFFSAILYTMVKGRLNDVGLILCIVYLLIRLFFLLLAILLAA